MLHIMDACTVAPLPGCWWSQLQRNYKWQYFQCLPACVMDDTAVFLVWKFKIYLISSKTICNIFWQLFFHLQFGIQLQEIQVDRDCEHGHTIFVAWATDHKLMFQDKMSYWAWCELDWARRNSVSMQTTVLHLSVKLSNRKYTGSIFIFRMQ